MHLQPPARSIVLALSLALTFSTSLAAPPTDPPGQPFLIDTSAAYITADSGTRSPAAASNGSFYLVTWQDLRDGQWDIYAARVSPDGRVLDSIGFAVSREVDVQQNPVVASDGSGFLVAWEDQRGGLRWNVYAARVDSAGRVLDPAGILLRGVNGDKRSPAVTYGAGRYLVTWDEYYGSRNVVAAFVDSTGQTGEAIEVCAAPDAQGSPSAAFGDSVFLVAWDDARNGGRSQIYAARLTASGAVLDSGGFPVFRPHDAQQLPSVGFDGTNFLVAWQEGPVLGSNIAAARISESGVVLDTTAINVSDAARDQFRPRVTSTDSQYFVAWEDRRSSLTGSDIYCARVLPSGAVADTAGVQVCGAVGRQAGATIAVGAGELLAAWQDGQSDSVRYGIRASRLSVTGVVLDSTPIPVSPYLRRKYTRQDSPSLAYGNNSWLVVWSDYRPDTVHRDIHAMRIDGSGRPLDSAAIGISWLAGEDQAPRAAFDGTNFLIVWQHTSGSSYDIYGRRIDTSGVLLDTSAIPITATGTRKDNPAVAYDGSNFLVVWQELEASSFRVRGRRVSRGGVVIDSAPIPVSGYDGAVAPAIASGDSWCLVAWQDAPQTSVDIHAVRVAQDGRIIDSLPITLNTGSRRCELPAVAWDGERFFVVWANRLTANLDICGALASWSGGTLETTQVTVSRGALNESDPSVAFNGQYYYMAWSVAEFRMMIRGARIAQTGEVMDVFDLLWESQDYYPGGLAAGPDSAMLFVFTTVADSINGFPANCSRAWGLFSPFSAIHEDAGSGSPSKSLSASPSLFRLRTTIGARSGTASVCRIRIHDADGRAVRLLTVPGGQASVTWDGTDDEGNPLPAGVYFATPEPDATAGRARLVLIR